MVNYKCSDCKWFDKAHMSLSEFPNNFGYCRKHKPVIYSYSNQNIYYGGWPLVDINDFCGEFRQDESE